jgi:hypothetical protein
MFMRSSVPTPEFLTRSAIPHASPDVPAPKPDGFFDYDSAACDCVIASL